MTRRSARNPKNSTFRQDYVDKYYQEIRNNRVIKINVNELVKSSNNYNFARMNLAKKKKNKQTNLILVNNTSQDWISRPSKKSKSSTVYLFTKY